MNWVKDTYFKCFNIPTHGLALAASVEWPGPDWNWWVNYDTPTSFKYASRSMHECSSVYEKLIDKIIQNVPDFVCNNKKAFPDLSLHGAGLHEIPPTGFIRNHVDALEHPTKNWRREYTIILYLNSEWQEEWGGAFCINDSKGETLEKIYPVYEQLLIFQPTPHTYHSVEPVYKGAPSRKTLTLFYWSECEKQGLNTQADFGGINDRQAY